VNTAFGAVPDIYLSSSITRTRRQPTTIPIQTTNYNTLGRTSYSTPKPKPTASTIFNSSPIRSSGLYSSSPSISYPIRQNTLVNRTATSALPTRSITTTSNYTNAYNHGANNRPVSSTSAYQNHHLKTGSNGYLNTGTIRQLPEPSRMNSASTKPFELTRDFYFPTKINTFRTVKYVPSSYNRYHLP
jgi:hypothetical protein